MRKLTLRKQYAKCALKKRIEDWRNFLEECPPYNKVRKSLKKHVDPNKDDLSNQFIQLMAISNQNVIDDIARNNPDE